MVQPLIGRDLTKAFRIEPRQHDLFGIDLGEGPRRRLLGLGALAFGVWVPLMALLLFGLLRLQFDPNMVVLFMAPPVALLMIGFQEDQQIPARMRLTSFSLRVHRIFAGAEPIINLGASRASRREMLSLSARLNRSARAEDLPAAPPTVHLAFKARVIGQDYMAEIIRAQKGKK